MPLKKIERKTHTVYDDKWVLENISETFSKIDPHEIDFPVFPVHKTHFFSTTFQEHSIDWYVKLMFCNNELRGGFMISFDAVEQFKPKNHVTCNIYLVDADENKFFIGRKNRKFDSTYFYNAIVHSSALSQISELPNTEDKLLPNDTMTLRIELIIYLDDNPIFPLEYISYNIEPVVSLDNILKLYPFQDDGDVKIYVESVEFSVHKAVLKTRCPKAYEVVARCQQMPDSNNNQLVLTDIKPDIFKRVLEFIYTGKVEDLDDHAEDLLKAASKYELIGLKYLCEFSLTDNYLTYKNSGKVEKLARRCSATFLLFNLYCLRNDTTFPLVDYSCTPSGTLITTRSSGKRSKCKKYFKNGKIPMGIKIVAD